MTNGLFYNDNRDSTPAHDGPGHMAFDQTILELTDKVGTPVFRCYQWRQPTLSLGYFQGASERETHPSSARCPLLRRSTGGGAILHDRELTYSLALPIRDRVQRDVSELYQTVHNLLIEALADWSVTANRFAELPKLNNPQSQSAPPFLCFQRRTDDDLIVNGYKVVGSAQRRAAKAVLQHGSILLATSPAAPELPGIAELTGKQIPADQLAMQLAEMFAARLQIDFKPATPTPRLIERSKEIRNQRFASNEWTFRRS